MEAIKYCDNCESCECRCGTSGSNKYSGPRDRTIGAPRENGKINTQPKSGFSAKEIASTGLTLREKL